MGEAGGTIGGIMNAFKGPTAPEAQPLAMGGGGSAYQPSATAMGGETPLSQAKGMLASSGGSAIDLPIGSATPAAVPRASAVLGSGAMPSTAQAFGTKPDPMVPGTGMLPSYAQAPGGVAPGTGALDNPNILPDQKTGGRGINWDDLKTGLNIANATSQTARGLYGDLSRGPGASPLMAPRVGGAGAYQPTARRKSLRLSDILGQR